MTSPAFRLQGRVEVDTSPAEQGLSSLSRTVQSFGQSVQSGLAIGAGIAAFQEGLRLLEGSFASLKSSVIDFNQQIDMANTTFLRYFKGNQEAATSFMETLKQFANVTPFEFKDLVPLAVKLQNANLNAKDLIPTIQAIGEASSATGQVSKMSIDRIGLALTQMSQTGKVTGGDMRQLTEALVPAWQILADATGKPIPVLQKLASAGQISSEVFLDAFRKYYAGAGLMEAANETLSGALSTVRDVGTQAFADIGRSIYDLATAGANQLAEFFKSADFATWVQAAKVGVDDLVNTFKGFLASLAPLGDGIKAAFSMASSGNLSGALGTLTAAIDTQLGAIWDRVTGFASSMIGAGTNVVKSFADGMLTGGYNAIVGAIDTITEFIASMLMGNSPPMAGPLHRIDEGGASTAKAWVAPFADTMQKGVGDAVSAIAQTILGLKDAARDITDQIRGITEQSQALDHTMRGLKDSVDEVKKGFEAQKLAIQDMADASSTKYAAALQGVRDKIDAVKDSHEAVATSIQKQIDAVKDQYGPAVEKLKTSIADIGDKYKTAEDALNRQISAVKDKYTAQLDAVKEKIANIMSAEEKQLAPLQKQLQSMQDANKYLHERQDAEKSIADAKLQQAELDALGDPKQRADLAGKLAGVQAQQQQVDLAQQLSDAQDKLAKGGLSSAEQKSLELKISELKIQKQLADMVDTTRLADATRNKDLAAAQDQQLSTTRAITDAEQKLKEIPIEKKIADIKSGALDALQPLQQSLKDIESQQKKSLDPLESKLRSLKNEGQDALRPLQTQLHDLEHQQAAALAPLEQSLRNVKREEQDLLVPLQNQLQAIQKESDTWSRAFSASLKDVDKQQRDALQPLQAQLDILEHQKQALEEQKQELEGIKQRIQEQISLQQEAARAAKAGANTGPTGPVDRSFTGDPTAGVKAEEAKARGAALAKQLSDGITTWFDEHKQELATRILGFFTGGLFFGPLGAIAGAVFLPKFIESLEKALKEHGFDAQPLIDEIGKSAETGDYTVPAFNISSGITFAITRLPWTIAKAIWGAISASWTNSESDGNNVGRAIARGIGEGISRMVTADLLDLGKLARGIFVWIGDALRADVTEAQKEFAIIGTAITDGLIAGMRTGFVAVGNFLRQMTALIVGLFKEAFGIKSPSAVFDEIGQNVMQGLLDGLTTKWEDVKKWWTDLPTNIQTAFGWDGKQFTWVETLKSMGTTMLMNIWEGLDFYWTQFSQWWVDLPVAIQKAFGWDGKGLAWVADLKKIGTTILTNIWDGLNEYWAQFSQWWTDLPKQIQTAFGWDKGTFTWVADLKAMGTGIIEGIQQGILDKVAGFSDFLKVNFADPLPGWLKDLLGIHSPSALMVPIGEAVIAGIIQGLENKMPDIKKKLSDIMGMFGGGGGGDYTGNIDINGWLQEAIKITGVPDDWMSGLQWIVGHEDASGDPNAKNPDSTATGLFQLIDTTWNDLASRFRLRNVKDPIDNAVAGIHYIQERYGNPDNAVEWWKDHHWYDKGGIAWGPQMASLAEHEPEVIIPRSWFASASGLSSNSGGGGGASAPMEQHRIDVYFEDHVVESIVLRGRDIAIKRGSIPAGSF